jgi:hypothetical protein
MLKCQAVIDFDVNKEIYTVTVVAEDGTTAKYLVPFIEARDQKIQKDPETYAAMKAINIFMEQHEQKEA